MINYMEILKNFGFPVFMAIIIWVQLRNQNETMQKWLGKLIDRIGKTNLNTKQSVIVFEALSKNSQSRKLKLVQEILIENDIKNRQESIEQNIRSQFQTITREDITTLRELNMISFSSYLEDLDWDIYLSHCYKIIFFCGDIDKKLIDLKNYIQSYTTNMISKYEKANSFTED